LAATIAKGLPDLAGEAGLSLRDLSGLGVGLPGFVDGGNGVIRWIPGMVDQPYALAKELETALGVSVSIDNTANIIARAERWFGAGDVNDFAIVLVSSGVGAGIYANGQLLGGAGGIAGELGHMAAGVDSPVRCACGNHDCVAVHAGAAGMVRQAVRLGLLPQGEAVDLRTSINRLASLAAHGDAAARSIFAQGGRALGIALANLARITAPARIIVSFEIGAVVPFMHDELIQNFQARTSAPIGQSTELIVRKGLSGLGQGAAALALERIYASGARVAVSD
jgi:predicted NBD/HSP70 family sugar kinase